MRVSSAALAQAIKIETDCDAIFNLGTRDMNKLAIQSHLLGAQLMGLENVLVLQGDPFTAKQLQHVKEVADFSPTGLIAAIRDMNFGLDYKGLKLKSATDFCIGATIDLSRGIDHEALLTVRKHQAGADYFVSQPIFRPDVAATFLEAGQQRMGSAFTAPVYWGLQVFTPGGVMFSSVPDSVRSQVESGHDCTKISLEIYKRLRAAGIKRFYLIPPILKGGRRDYPAAQAVLKAVRGLG